MKKLMLGFAMSLLFVSLATAQYGNSRSGFDGDFFSLEGAIELFKNSRSLQQFERRLNSKDSWVNNLDLNFDGRIDYIRVEHRRQGDFHAIILQVPVNRYDLQDVAVIEIEKTGRREAILQIIGDEYLYGDQVIVEPFENYARSDGWSGPNGNIEVYRGYTNVFYWPIVNSFFARNYRVYVSPYRWSYYPTYWQPWRPCTWDIFRPRIVRYHRFHRVVHVHRVRRVHDFYRPQRNYCPVVFRRTNEVRTRNGQRPYYSNGQGRNNGNSPRTRSNDGLSKSRNNAPRANNGNRGGNRTQPGNRPNTNRGNTTRPSTPNTNRGQRGNTTRPTAPNTNRGKGNTTRSTRPTTQRAQTSTNRGKGKVNRSTSSSNSRTRNTVNASKAKIQRGTSNRKTSTVSKTRTNRNTTTTRSKSKTTTSKGRSGISSRVGAKR